MRDLSPRLHAHSRPRPGRVSLVLLALAACGSETQESATTSAAGGTSPTPGDTTQVAPDAGSTIISLPVAITPLPWDPSGSSFDTSTMTVQVGDPAPVLNDTTGDAVVNWTNTTSVPASSCTTDAKNVRTCALTITDIETKDYSIGMLVKIGDSRTSFTGTSWNSLSTGVAQSTLKALRSAQAGSASASPAFAMTSDGTNQLATWSGVIKPDLITNGAMIGLIVDKDMQPVKGAQIAINDSSLRLVYANADFTGAGTPGPNATLPFFVVTPPSSKVVKSTGWTISAPAPATAKWTLPLVGSAPGYMVMIPFLGQ